MALRPTRLVFAFEGPHLRSRLDRCRALQHASIQTCNNFWANSHSVEGKMKREKKRKKYKDFSRLPLSTTQEYLTTLAAIFPRSKCKNVFTSGMTRTIVADSHIRRRRRRRLVSTRIIAVLTSWLSYRTISDRSVTRDDPSLQYYWFAWRISIPVSFFRPTINFANVSSVMLCPRTEMLAICKCISLSPSPVSRNELRVLRN